MAAGIGKVNASLAQAALRVLTEAEPAEKCTRTHEIAEAWFDGKLGLTPSGPPPTWPARPTRPELRPAREMPRRRLGGDKGRIALLHALAHIEFNAIDLAWDLLVRFQSEDMPRAFHDDWVAVANDEARHFTLLSARLESLGASYGDLPAHAGLWEAAEATAGDLLARLAVVPLVLEARGLDVTPGMIESLRRMGDAASADILEIIYQDEIRHVAAGVRWFHFLAERRGMEPRTAWREAVRRHFKGSLKPPFNASARKRAGFPASYYSDLAVNERER